MEQYVHLIASNNPMLFDLKTDPGERNDTAKARPEAVKALMVRLQKYIDSAVTPLNMYACTKKMGAGCRGTDPDAITARNAANSWVVWH